MDYNLVNAQRAMFLTGRGLLGLYFILPGISKIIGFAGMSKYMAAHGVPFVPLLLVGSSNLFGHANHFVSGGPELHG